MRLLFIILIALTVTGCGTFKRYRESHSDKSEIKVSADVSTKASDKTKTRIVEKVDTIVPIKEDSVVLVRPLTEVLEGKPIEAKDGNNTVRVFYDVETETLRAVGVTEAHDLPISITKETEIENDIKVEGKTDLNVEENKVVETKTEEKEKKTSSGFNIGFWVGIVALMAVIALLLYLEKRRP